MVLNIMTEKLWTFIIEYEGGTYISQFMNMSLIEAIRTYNDTDPSGQGAVPLDEDYTPVDGITSTFCLGGHCSHSKWKFFKTHKTIFGNAILTSDNLPNQLQSKYPMKEFIAKLFADFKSGEDEFYVNANTWRELSKEALLPLSKTLDCFGTCLAKMYDQGDLDYEFCDALVNIAFSDALDSKGNWPTDFYEVYEAFDAGEYYRKDDKSDDPVAEHTNPMIQEFLERINSNP